MMKKRLIAVLSIILLVLVICITCFPFLMMVMGSFKSARIDGATEFQILIKLAFPMLKPAIVSLAILTFMNTWNDFLWPIVITTKKENLTVTALLRSIGDSSLNGNYGMLLAAATLSVLPILLMYLIFHEQMVKGIIEGAVKG